MTISVCSCKEEEQVKKDVEKMDEMLSEGAKSQRIRYVFAIGSMSDMIKQRTKKTQREEEEQEQKRNNKHLQFLAKSASYYV